MDEEIQDETQVLETESAEEVIETVEETVDAEKEELRKKVADLESKNRQLFERVKKGDSALSTKDTIYLAKADIHEDDIEEVLTLAKNMGWDLPKAHKYLTPVLKERKEERATAAVSATGKQRPTVSEATGSVILNRASQGKLPEDDEGIQRLVEAEIQRKLGK